MVQEPYIEETEVIVHRRYNPNYGDNRVCNCGHEYSRHFDSYENMSDVGCKYCACGDFKEFNGDFEIVIQFVRDNDPSAYHEAMQRKKLLIKRHNVIEEEAHKYFLEECLEKHYRMTNRILNSLLGIHSATI